VGTRRHSAEAERQWVSVLRTVRGADRCGDHAGQVEDAVDQSARIDYTPFVRSRHGADESVDLEVQRLDGVAADVGRAVARDQQHEERILETAQPTPGCSTRTVLTTFAQGLSQAGEFPNSRSGRQ
jgi:hypothetical protein